MGENENAFDFNFYLNFQRVYSIELEELEGFERDIHYTFSMIFLNGFGFRRRHLHLHLLQIAF